jgi:chromodomain-helicase-DNA-binding protein 7
VTDGLDFPVDKYIYPAGFKKSRLLFSTLDPSQKVRHASEILCTGGEKPLFRVTMDDHPEISFKGNSPSSPCNLLSKGVWEMRGDGRHSQIQGAAYSGLSSPVICDLIQHQNSRDCTER